MTAGPKEDEIQRATIEVIGPINDRWPDFKREMLELLEKYRKLGINARVRRLQYIKKPENPNAQFQ
jgi:hypothetical protein